MSTVLTVLADVVVLVLVARLVLSWLPLRWGARGAAIQRVVVLVTEPMVAPVRAVVRPVPVGGVAVDLAPALLILVLALVVAVLA